jgi:hypothetical protein
MHNVETGILTRKNKSKFQAADIQFYRSSEEIAEIEPEQRQLYGPDHIKQRIKQGKALKLKLKGKNQQDDHYKGLREWSILRTKERLRTERGDWNSSVIWLYKT